MAARRDIGDHEAMYELLREVRDTVGDSRERLARIEQCLDQTGAPERLASLERAQAQQAGVVAIMKWAVPGGPAAAVLLAWLLSQ